MVPCCLVPLDVSVGEDTIVLADAPLLEASNYEMLELTLCEGLKKSQLLEAAEKTT
jgi:hypothetical protein